MKLILLHGWGQNKHTWDTIVMKLNGLVLINNLNLTIETLDLPGFGNEELFDKELTIEKYAKWLDSKLKEIDDKFILLGHSFGGRIAAYYTAIYLNPNQKGLIIYGAPLIYSPKFKIRLFKFVSSNLKRLPFIYKFLKAQSKLSLNKEYESAKSLGLDAIYRNTVSFDQRKYIPNINAPTYLIWGENDIDAPVKQVEIIQELITKAQVVVDLIPNCGHNIHLERPDLFTAKIFAFIQKII